MIKYLLATAFAILMVAALSAAPRKIASLKVDDELKINEQSLAITNTFETVKAGIASATNALARVAHTGSYTNLVNRPIDIRACLDDDGVTRFRIFTNQP